MDASEAKRRWTDGGGAFSLRRGGLLESGLAMTGTYWPMPS